MLTPGTIITLRRDIWDLNLRIGDMGVIVGRKRRKGYKSYTVKLFLKPDQLTIIPAGMVRRA